MVILYTGTPGSGKSYHATDIVHTATRRKKYIIANFVINLPEKQQPYFYFLDNKQMRPDVLIKFSREQLQPNKESQAILIIDEAATMFNSTYVKKGAELWIKFFSQHRKLGFDVILIAQNDKMLDRQVRANIEYHYLHRKIQNFGLKGFVIRMLLHKDFVCVHYWYGINERLGADYFRIKKKIAASYDTFSLFDYSNKSNLFGGLISAAQFNKEKGGEATEREQGIPAPNE